MSDEKWSQESYIQCSFPSCYDTHRKGLQSGKHTIRPSNLPHTPWGNEPGSSPRPGRKLSSPSSATDPSSGFQNSHCSCVWLFSDPFQEGHEIYTCKKYFRKKGACPQHSLDGNKTLQRNTAPGHSCAGFVFWRRSEASIRGPGSVKPGERVGQNCKYQCLC